MIRLRSIRSRILAAVVLVTTLVLAGGGTATVLMLTSYLDERRTGANGRGSRGRESRLDRVVTY